MWGLATAIFAACKVLTWTRNRPAAFTGRDAAYLLLWAGMDARAFLDKERRPSPPVAAEWLFAAAKLAMGVVLLWIVAPWLSAPLLRGWLGMLAVIFILHFGLFHLLSLAWRSAGVQAEPLMKAPILSASLGELWGKRWNLGFHDLAREYVFAPVSRRHGAGWGSFAVFLASGLVHDLVISVPAGGGYGLPTAYFLLQWAGVAAERKWKFESRVFAIVIALGPVYWLFHPSFVRNVFLPFMEAIGA
ncbi:MAG TPA: MBOAT family protein [Planctomycetota bacterium]|nr:MBOAT family protein [Planctomycetota bacterium]